MNTMKCTKCGVMVPEGEKCTKCGGDPEPINWVRFPDPTEEKVENTD